MLVLRYVLQRSNPSDPVRAIAVARTLTAVRDLDGDRKGTLIRYLWEAGLIEGPHPIVDIHSADLTGAVFNRADLHGVALFQLLLNNAQFIDNTSLANADLSGSLLYESDMENASLSGANLSDSDPIGANLTGANLTNTVLTGADLTGADLTRAILTGANLKDVRYNSKPEYVYDPQQSLVLEEPTQWPQGFNPQAAGATCYTC
jgi:uncharacterized protein YjbI with pentapeptide repeats